LDFAAYRYSLASLVLLAASSVKRPSRTAAKLTNKDVILLVVIGLLGYTLAQGSQFVGLSYLPAVTTSFLQNFTPVFVLFIAYLTIGEAPVPVQYIGFGVAIAGVLAFFAGQPLEAEATGVIVILLGSVAWAAYLVVIKKAKVVEKLGALRFTTLTMGAGSLMLLAAALISGGAPSLGLNDWLIILWLSLLNTALAFYLWNVALKTLKAFELSILQNTMLVQIALLSWYFLGEEITLNMAIGMMLILIGSGIVQFPEFWPVLFRSRERNKQAP
jgi:drug/metabolite transporter (DMT)-like permease